MPDPEDDSLPFEGAPLFDPEIAAAYSARGTVSPETFARVMDDYRTRSERAVRDLPGARGVAYDEHSDEVLDVWGIADAPRPVFLVIHGGYWRSLSRLDTAFMARTLADHGIATVAVDYGLAPATSLPEMVRQVRAAVAWVHRDGPAHGLDRNRIVVCGSSAGAHLAATTMIGGWQADLGLPDRAVHAGLLISGLYDLRPLIHAEANEWLFLTEQSAADLSPALAPLPDDPAPAVIAMAEHEADGFRRQSRDFHRHWARGSAGPLLTVPGRNHFDVFVDLADRDTELSSAVHRLFALTAPTHTPK
ncbi:MULTISPECIES: alpha/beta hydrolase [Gordonia]|uniref:alpha/beta hydrolase n=1 Tax=Gordonia TaxID=2053 RepID=UPI001E4BCF11|nr:MULTISPECIES: alpha/beta hydrolase [Gordonia]